MSSAVITRPPGPKNPPLWGHLWAFRRDPLKFLHDLTGYGNIVYFHFGPQRVYLINHPDYVKEVLVNNPRNFIKSRALQRSKRLLGEGLLTSEADQHKRQRRLVQPAFHRQRIAGYAAAMTAHAATLRARWRTGETLDIAEEMMGLTLNIVAKTLFDTEVAAEAKEIGRAMTAVVNTFKILTLPFSELIEKLPLPSMRELNRSRALLDRTIYRIINERRASGQDRGDLLSMLLMAQDEEGDGTGMSDKQVRDEAMTLFIAGHETTANALTWTWYLLSQHPEVEAKVWQTIDETIGNRLPTADDFAKLKYLEMVFAEAMRLYPPAWVLGRLVASEIEIGGYSLPVGSIAFMSPYLMHRDARFFAEPERFDPQRWTAEAQASRPRFSYFPFGGGPRQCIGEPFAWMEGVLLLATIAQKWRLRLAPNHTVIPEPLITLRPKKGMPMIVTAR